MPKAMSEIEKACLAGRVDEAEQLLQKTPKAETETADYQYNLGRVRESQGRYEEAIEAYERALQLDATHRPTLFRLAYLYDLRGEEGLAIDYYKQCIQQPPVHEGALMNLGVLYEDAGRYDDAIECFSRILQGNPTNARARLFLRDAESSKSMYYDEESERRRDKRNQVLEIPVTDFELSVRSRNCLKKMNIRTLGDLIRHTEQELLSYKNFGETSLQEIKDMLTSKGLHLGMAVEPSEERRAPAPPAPPPGHARRGRDHPRRRPGTVGPQPQGPRTAGPRDPRRPRPRSPRRNSWRRRTSARPRSTRSSRSSAATASTWRSK